MRALPFFKEKAIQSQSTELLFFSKCFMCSKEWSLQYILSSTRIVKNMCLSRWRTNVKRRKNLHWM